MVYQSKLELHYSLVIVYLDDQEDVKKKVKVLVSSPCDSGLHRCCHENYNHVQIASEMPRESSGFFKSLKMKGLIDE